MDSDIENQFKIFWHDSGKEPKCKPNPLYPNGIALDASNGAQKTCTVSLSYPAKRCGYYEIQCQTCGIKTACTTAGRIDDPISMKIACKK